MNLEIGSTIGDYQIVGMLGAGGMGKVFKVRNVISDRLEAMKVLLPDLASDTELADRFMREIKVQASLVHPNIASLHTALRIDNQLLMLMEFVEGVTLEHQIKQQPLPPPLAVDYIMQVLAALDFAHKHGVIHRDIKPANMMLTPAGVVKLMDFGIAKAASDHRLTQTGTTMGSLYYMSPEQIQGASDLDARADLYSVGVALYELVTGKRPFDGDSQFAIMSAHLEKQPVPPITLDPSMPQPLNDAILLAVAKDPNARFQSAGAFRAALGNVAGMLKPAAAAAATVVAPRAAAQAQPRAAVPAAAPPAVAGKKGGRGLWIGVGALATAMAVVGLVQFGPWKGTSAAPQQPVMSTPAPVQTTPASQAPPLQPQAPAAQQQAPATVQPQPVRGTQPAAAPARQAATQTGRPATSTPPQQQQQQAPPPQVQQQAAPPVQQPQQQAPPSRPAIDPAKQAELQKIREDLVMLQTRANTARSGVQRVERTQAASGLGLRGDIQNAASLMGTYLDGAVAALNAADPGSARNFMDKAERQIDTVEKFLGR